MITGINHITLAVHDIDRSFAFYHTVLGFQPIAKWPKGASIGATQLGGSAHLAPR